MLIDLHCHTKKTKVGDPSSRNVSPNAFANAVSEAGVSFVAITNHNVFDSTQFDELKQAVGENAQLWPGVELDVCGSRDSSHWHMLVVASPNEQETFAAAVDELVQGKPADSVLVNIKSVFEAFSRVNTIFISHAHDKSPVLSQEDMEEMNGLAVESWRLFYEPRKLATVGIWTNHGFNMMLGSDVRNWSNYPGCELPSLRMPVDSFEQFCLLAKRDGSTISTLLNRVDQINVIGHPCQGVNVPLKLRNDINVFFGQKGTGKTELLKSLEKQLIGRGKTCCSYYGNETSTGFKELLSNAGIERNLEEFGRSDGVADLTFISGWKDTNVTPLCDYVDWLKTRNNNKNKKRFELSEAQSIHDIGDSGFNDAKEARATVQKFIQRAKERRYTSYLGTEDGETLTVLLQKLQQSIDDACEERYVEYRSIELANAALERIKQLIDAKSNTKSKPSTTGFVEFARNRVKLLSSANNLHNNLEPCERFSKMQLGVLDDKGKVFIITRRRFLCEKSRTIEFDLGIRKLEHFKEKLEDVRNNALNNNASKSCSSLQEAQTDAELTDLSSFIGIKRYVALEASLDEYEPSSGEKSILLLSHKLNESSADVFILDEPELSMSNSYIDAVIRDKIQQIAAQNKTVLLATHNANLAVRTLPYVSVYREHVNRNNYRTYVGNPFSDELVDIQDPTNTLGWAAKSLEVLEGSQDAFYNRKDIYEAGTK